jgi:hypothetical protein
MACSIFGQAIAISVRMSHTKPVGFKGLPVGNVLFCGLLKLGKSCKKKQ